MNCVTCRVSWFQVSSVAGYAVEPTRPTCVRHRGRSALSRVRHSLPPAPAHRRNSDWNALLKAIMPSIMPPIQMMPPFWRIQAVAS